MEETPTILVVDDQLLNIRLLERKLELSEMKVISCTNGPEALELASEHRPDVILLDIMMAGMNGFEVCQELKKQEKTKDIPVIFITALTSKEEKIEGLGVGAADYVTKPLDLDEILARVRTQIRIVHEHRANIRLTKQLEESRRQSAMMHLTEGIAHNLNNLLGVIAGYTSLLERNAENPEKIRANCIRLESAITRMTRVIQQLTVIGQFKSLQREPAPLKKILHAGIARFHQSSGTETEVIIESDLEENFSFVTNAQLMQVCLERLLQNAYESYFENDLPEKQPEITEIRITADLRTVEGVSCLQLSIFDRGLGISETIRDSIFDPFVSSSSAVGRGMGLTIARHSVRCLQGDILASDRQDGGSVFRVLLPLNLEPSSSDNKHGT